jgi:hypothetical protein
MEECLWFIDRWFVDEAGARTQGGLSSATKGKARAKLGIVDRQQLAKEPVQALDHGLIRRFIMVSCEQWVAAHFGV